MIQRLTLSQNKVYNKRRKIVFLVLKVMIPSVENVEIAEKAASTQAKNARSEGSLHGGHTSENKGDNTGNGGSIKTSNSCGVKGYKESIATGRIP